MTFIFYNYAGIWIVRNSQKIDLLLQVYFFIQSEGLVCNRRQANVITRSVYVITEGVFLQSFALITYISLEMITCATEVAITFRLTTDYIQRQSRWLCALQHSSIVLYVKKCYTCPEVVIWNFASKESLLL